MKKKVETRIPIIGLSILPGQTAANARAVTLKLDGCDSVPIDLRPAQFRVLYLLTRAVTIDAADAVPDHLWGFRSSPEIGRLYKLLVNNDYSPSEQYIRAQIMLVRKAVKAAIKVFEATNAIEFDWEFDAFDCIETKPGFGYRMGKFKGRIVDHNRKMIKSDRGGPQAPSQHA